MKLSNMLLAGALALAFTGSAALAAAKLEPRKTCAAFQNTETMSLQELLKHREHCFEAMKRVQSITTTTSVSVAGSDLPGNKKGDNGRGQGSDQTGTSPPGGGNTGNDGGA